MQRPIVINLFFIKVSDWFQVGKLLVAYGIVQNELCSDATSQRGTKEKTES